MVLQILAVAQEDHPLPSVIYAPWYSISCNLTYTCSSRRHRSLPTCFCTPPGIHQSTLSQVKLLVQNLVLFFSYL